MEAFYLDLTIAISMLGAIALFLFGMTTMTEGLEQLSSGRLERILEKLTNNVFKSVALGALVTGLIQSSAATTVMCVGFVNAGVMKLEQTVGVIMGANIGTTVTAQLLRLSSISSENPLMVLLKPSFLGPILAMVGVIFYLFIKGGKKKSAGQIVLGLGVLFIGMNTMTAAVAPLQELPEFQRLFTAFSNPILGVVVGAAVTALLQSSSASMGILQAVSTTGVVTFNVAIPLIMGQNIGTTVTALLSAAGASKNAKRTALIHVFFNLIGSVFFLVVLYAANALFRLPFWTDTMDMGSIANLHLLFNVACTALLLPFHKILVRLVERLVPGEAGPSSDASALLDQRFLSSPAVALDQAHEVVIRMGLCAQENYRAAVGLLTAYDPKVIERISETEAALDKMENALDNYLVQLTHRALSPQENAHVSELLHALSDFERIGDYSVNISECASAMQATAVAFSPDGEREMAAITAAVDEAIGCALACYRDRSYDLALQVEPIEEVVDLMRESFRSHHIERFKDEQCSIEAGAQFLELLVQLERISDHCSNIALLILRQTAPAGDIVHTDTHAYTHQLHHGKDPRFLERFAQCKAKYYDPLTQEESLSTE